MRFQKGSVFVLIESASIDSCPHYRFDAFSTVNTKTIDLHVVTQVEHYAHVTNTRAYDILRRTWYI